MNILFQFILVRPINAREMGAGGEEGVDEEIQKHNN